MKFWINEDHRFAQTQVSQKQPSTNDEELSDPPSGQEQRSHLHLPSRRVPDFVSSGVNNMSGMRQRVHLRDLRPDGDFLLYQQQTGVREKAAQVLRDHQLAVIHFLNLAILTPEGNCFSFKTEINWCIPAHKLDTSEARLASSIKPALIRFSMVCSCSTSRSHT